MSKRPRVQSWPSAADREQVVNWALDQESGALRPATCQTHLTAEHLFVVGGAGTPTEKTYNVMVEFDAGAPSAVYAMQDDSPGWWIRLETEAETWCVESEAGAAHPSLTDETVFPLFVAPHTPFVPGCAPIAFHVDANELAWIVFEGDPEPRIWDPNQGEAMARNGQTFACPQCTWRVTDDCDWQCSCGHVWNTFHTGGKCPACGHQWKETICLQCHEWSAHTAWYRTSENRNGRR